MEGRTGLVGLGNMGQPIADRLTERGLVILAYDKDPTRAAKVAGSGAEVADSLSDLGRKCDVVLLSLPTPSVVRSVVKELSEAMRPGSIIVDLSTNDAVTPRDLAAALAEHSIAYVDAPVSGGPTRAGTGQLTTMVGGKDDAVERVRPLLDMIAHEVEHVGPSGAGGVAKLLNNFVAIWNMVGVSQAFLAGTALNISSERLYGVLSKSSGRSYSLDRNYPKIRDHDFRASFSAQLAEKDFRLALDLIAGTGRMVVGDQELRTLFSTAARELGDSDVAVIHEILGRTTSA